MKRQYIKLVLFCYSLLFVACGIKKEYAPLRAFLHIENVSTLAPLYESLTGHGSFCRISFEPSGYRCVTNRGSKAFRPFTQIDRLNPPVAVAGIIVGLPNMPDLDGGMHPIAYDGVCVNCYEELDKVVNVDFFKQGTAYVRCRSCKRVYDLNNKALVVEGQKGRPLYRYHLQYDRARNVLVVR